MAVAALLIQNLFPPLRLPILSDLFEMAVGALASRIAGKQIVKQLVDASELIAQNTVWIDGRVVAGALPIGTTLTPVAINQKVFITAGVRIDHVPLIMRLSPPEQPWVYKTKEEFWEAIRPKKVSVETKPTTVLTSWGGFQIKTDQGYKPVETLQPAPPFEGSYIRIKGRDY